MLSLGSWEEADWCADSFLDFITYFDFVVNVVNRNISKTNITFELNLLLLCFIFMYFIHIYVIVLFIYLSEDLTLTWIDMFITVSPLSAVDQQSYSGPGRQPWKAAGGGPAQSGDFGDFGPGTGAAGLQQSSFQIACHRRECLPSSGERQGHKVMFIGLRAVVTFKVRLLIINKWLTFRTNIINSNNINN